MGYAFERYEFRAIGEKFQKRILKWATFVKTAETYTGQAFNHYEFRAITSS